MARSESGLDRGRHGELHVRRHRQRRHDGRSQTRHSRRSSHPSAAPWPPTPLVVGTIVNDDEPPPVITDVVISQVYGGGGNAGATLTHDFIELFNPRHHGGDPGRLVGSVHVGGGNRYVAGDAARRAASRRWLLPGSAGAGIGRHDAAARRHDATGTIAMGAGAGQGRAAGHDRCHRRTVSRSAGRRISSATASPPPASKVLDRRPRPRTRPRRCASVAAASIPTTTTSTSRSAALRRATPRRRRGAARRCRRRFTTSRAPGSTSPFVGPGRHHHRHRHRDQVERLLPADAGCDVDADPATSEAHLRVHVGGAGGRRRERGDGSRHGERVLQPDADRELAARRRHRDRAQRRASSAVTLTPAILDPAGTPRSARTLRRHADARGVADLGRADQRVRRDRHRADRRAAADARAGYPGARIRCRPIRPRACPTAASRDSTRTPSASSSTATASLGAAVLSVTSNVVLTNVTGPLDFTFGAYKMLPETPPATSAPT